MADRDHIRDRALGALAAVVALALGIGVLLAAGAYAAARMVGLTADGGHQASTRPVAASHAPPAPAPPSGAATPTKSPSTAEHQQPTASQPAGSKQQTRRPHPRHKPQARPDQRSHRHSRVRRHHHRHHRRQAATGTLTLHASPTRVRPMGRIDLGGRCGCRSGTTLVVQRLEHGHWSRFPATATASGGRFHTWVMTGRSGPNRFRVVLPGGPASNPVTITVT